MTNIQSKEFYKEAESMEKGWGKYLKEIDQLKDKVDGVKDITLKEACWILYGHGWCSFYWENFFEYCKLKNLSKKKMIWQGWKGLFDTWVNTFKK